MLIFIKPTKSVVPVRKPNGDYLAEAGEKVERSSYWVRRIQDGDVVELKAQAKAK